MISFQLQELNFTLFVQQFKPTVLNLNTLQRAGIIKEDWELAEEPVFQANGTKLVFTNKVRIIAQADKIIFAETVGSKRLQDAKLPDTVTNFIQSFLDIKYQAIFLSPGGYAQFNSASEACKYLSEGLLASTPWQKFNGQEINAVGLKLAYPYKSGNFYLDINQANLEFPNAKINAVWFAGNFSYQLLGNDNSQKYLNLKNIIKDLDSDLKNYQDFVDYKLLAVSVMPSFSIFPLS